MGLYTNSTGLNTSTKFTRMYSNQFFDYLSEQLPQDHKQMLQWCEVVFYNSPALVNGIKKLIGYPITNFEYKTESDRIRSETKQLLEGSLNMKQELLQAGLDYYVYGNTYRSISFPFTRNLKCANCDAVSNAEYADYSLKKGNFILKCGHCGVSRKAVVSDDHHFTPEKLKIIKWDPKQVALLSNPVTEDVAYYYSLPKTLKQGLIRGEKVMAEKLPKIFLEAFIKNSQVQFNDNFYHMRTSSVSGYGSGWGVSPLVPALKLYLYNAILRKSVEAIGLEHITPKRVLFPQGSSSDPTLTSSMGRWHEEITKALDKWRQDPNYTMLAPYPTGVANLGSQGRAIMPTEEIKQTDRDMLLALDIPLEFVYGGMKLDTGSVALRVLENQLYPYKSQLEHFTNWVIDTINAKYKKNFCHIRLSDFTLSDDLQKKQLMMNMAGQGVSITTLQESLGLDPQEERDKQKDETIRAYKSQKALEEEQRKVDQDLASRAAERERADQEGTLPSYDQQKLVAAAQMKAQEMLSVPYEERRSLLAQLSNEDYVMYALVSAQMDSMRSTLEKQGPGAAG